MPRNPREPTSTVSIIATIVSSCAGAAFVLTGHAALVAVCIYFGIMALLES